MKLLFQIGALLFLTCTLWGQKAIPQYPGDENPRHDNQPSWCIAKDTNGFTANCGKCDRACDSDNDSRCRTWCRSRTACRCNVSCVPTGHAPRLNPLDPRAKAAIIAKGDGAKAVAQWAASLFFPRGAY